MATLPAFGASNFYPRPPRGGRRPERLSQSPFCEKISIHALREEGDGLMTADLTDGINFYPRPPRGGRPIRCRARSKETKFLSTPSARRATENGLRMSSWPHEFLSTPSARRATWSSRRLYGCQKISIHALREEGDAFLSCAVTLLWYFYPRPPRGGRHVQTAILSTRLLFLSTPSARRATLYRCLFCKFYYISIHALREEGDDQRRLYAGVLDHFYPRPPRGGRPVKMSSPMCVRIFLSTPSARRATGCCCCQ